METRKRPHNVEMPINKHYQHDLSHRHTTTLDFFRLQPVMCQDMVPGDKMSVDLRTLIQSSPMATQVFGGAHLDLHAFFVPNRILWDEWDAYFTGDSREENTLYTPPYITQGNLSSIMGFGGSTVDNSNEVKERRRVFGSLGLPTSTGVNYNNTNVRFLLFQQRAYQRIWWDYYRDSVNIPEKDKLSYLSTIGGPLSGNENMATEFEVRYRCFKKDFISTLLPSPQMGEASYAHGNFDYLQVNQNLSNLRPMYLSTASATQGVYAGSSTSASQSVPLSVMPEISVAAMRGATAMQRYLERLNIVGTRTMERLLATLGVKPTAERLDMAEFIGGHTIKVNIDGLVNSGSNEEVTSDSTSAGNYNAWGIRNNGGSVGDNHLGQGYQTGYGAGSGNSPKFNYTAVEHGYFMVIASLVPEYANPNSVNRQFYRGVNTADMDKFDFYSPDFDGLGYQEMLACEVATPNGTDTSSEWPTTYDPFSVVGYQPKYEDYRFVQDRVSGDFLEPQSAVALRNMVFVRSLPQVMTPSEMVAGLKLTTSGFGDRALFDQHFQISDPSIDHFVLHMYIVNDASRPVTNNQLPTELSDLANSEMFEISNGGVRL